MEANLDDLLPIRKIGYLAPLPVIDNAPYEFYQVAPPRVQLASISVGLEELNADDVERALGPLEALIKELTKRGVDIVLQAGAPLPLLIGKEAIQRVLERIEQVAGVPATSTVFCVVKSAQALGLKSVALTNKWSDAMNQSLADYFADGGISVAGVSSKALPLSELTAISSSDGMQLAYQLARQALLTSPDADGLYMGGGTWLTLPIIPLLEAEFGKPVISNQVAQVWSVCHDLQCWQPKEGFGRLIATA